MKLQAEPFGCLEVEQELQLDGPNHRKIVRLFSLEDSPGVAAGLVECMCESRAIAHQAAGFDTFARRVHRRNRMASDRSNDTHMIVEHEGPGADKQRARAGCYRRRNCLLDF